VKQSIESIFHRKSKEVPQDTQTALNVQQQNKQEDHSSYIYQVAQSRLNSGHANNEANAHLEQATAIYREQATTIHHEQATAVHHKQAVPKQADLMQESQQQTNEKSPVNASVYIYKHQLLNRGAVNKNNDLMTAKLVERRKNENLASTYVYANMEEQANAIHHKQETAIHHKQAVPKQADLMQESQQQTNGKSHVDASVYVYAQQATPIV